MDRVRIAYGEHPEQFGYLYLPETASGPLPVLMVIHGGSWRATYNLNLGTTLAVQAARMGYAAWNIEYRRVGAGGRWPEISADVRAAWDAVHTHLPEHAPVDPANARVVGHSAGAQLAVWLAGEPTKHKPVQVISQAGGLDTVTGPARGYKIEAFEGLFGKSYDQAPETYRSASPMHRLPIGVPVVCLHGSDDVVVPAKVSRRYASAAQTAGDPVQLHVIDGEVHESFLDRSSECWRRTLEVLGAGQK